MIIWTYKYRKDIIELRVLCLNFLSKTKPHYQLYSLFQGPGGVTVKKTNQALIIGIYDEPMTPGQCNMIVERLGDYLIDQEL